MKISERTVRILLQGLTNEQASSAIRSFELDMYENGYLADQSRQMARIGNLLESNELTVEQIMHCMAEDEFETAERVERRPKDWGQIRKRVFKRDGHVCAYCRTTKSPLEIDHVHPVAEGGTHDMENLVVACRPCNMSKRANFPEFWAGRATS